MSSIVVVSDLHIASGPLDDCDAELQNHFESFIESLCQAQTDVELVLNGDFLDFVQAEPWSGSDLESVSDDNIPLCFTEEQSLAKLESIHSAHGAVFTALRAFLQARPNNRITVLPGNHDADFYWEGVRRRFAELVGPANVFLDEVYRPPSCPSIWIEHGHQSDPVNCFHWANKSLWRSDMPPIFRDRTGTLRLYECVGTRLMIRFLNYLDQEYPFVDNVKPFSRFVNLFAASAFDPRYGVIKVAVILGRMLALLSTTALRNESDILAIRDETRGLLQVYLWQRLKSLSAVRLEALVARMASRGFAAEKPLVMYLQTSADAEMLAAFFFAHQELLDDLETPSVPLLGNPHSGTLTLTRGFSANETRNLAMAASKALGNYGVDLVIMGHTHEPVYIPKTRYINTGCWTRYLRLGPDDRTLPWGVLKADSYQSFPYELNYVKIVPEQVASTQLANYRERHD